MSKDNILLMLERNKGEVVTGGSIAKQLGISRTAVWKTMEKLRKQGCDIESLKNSGYRYTGGDILSEPVIREFSNARILGSRIDILKSVDSTNAYIKRQNLDTTQEGYVAIANFQSGGKGRMNREFHSPAGQGLYMSLLLKPRIPIENLQFITICAAVGVCRAIESVCGFSPQIKWVNDIFFSGKKLCGISTEAVTSAELGHTHSIIVGIGINTGNIPEPIQDIATSLHQITGVKNIRNRLAAAALTNFETVYFDYIENSNKTAILDEYIGKMFLIGKTVQVHNFGDSYPAEVMGVADSGALIVKDTSGAVSQLNSGEVSLTFERGV